MPDRSESAIARGARGLNRGMDRWTRRIATLGIVAAILFGTSHSRGAEAAKPNVIFFLADDLGYGDLGSFGQTKISTPNLDRLAGEGMRFTQHYSGNAVCAPSRCVLMTGKHPGHAFVRNNASVGEEGQYPLPTDAVTLGKLFQRQGYVTGAFGKWGLGGPDSTGTPLKQGVNRFFGYNCQGKAHNFYPTYLWDNDRRVTLQNPDFSSRQKFPADADPADPSAYARYAGKDYAPDLIAEQALAFVRDNKDKPFFLYVPTTVPHLALQVPEDSLAEYKGKFPEEPYLGDRGYLPHPYPRAAYAAMITRMDREVGRLMALVKELGLEERTLFVFSSDNGPLYDEWGGTDCEFFQSAGKLRGRKGSLYEGGIRVPTLARWKGKIAPGTTSDRVSGFEDWMPTFMELIGAPSSVPSDIDGISMAATLLGKTQEPRAFLYREFPAYDGQQSIRVGDWKGIRQDLLPRRAAAKKAAARKEQLNTGLQLYNLKSDPSETTDVAADHPDIVAQLTKLMREQHEPSAEFPFPALDQPQE